MKRSCILFFIIMIVGYLHAMAMPHSKDECVNSLQKAKTFTEKTTHTISNSIDIAYSFLFEPLISRISSHSRQNHFLVAMRAGDITVARILLERGMNAYTMDQQRRGYHHHRPSRLISRPHLYIDLFVEDEMEMTPLIYGAITGEVHFILKAAHNMLALQFPENTDAERLKLLFYEYVNKADKTGMTALMYAAQNGHAKAVHDLVSYQLNSKASTSIGIESHFDAMTSIDVNAVDHNGMTALAYALNRMPPSLENLFFWFAHPLEEYQSYQTILMRVDNLYALDYRNNETKILRDLIKSGSHLIQATETLIAQQVHQPQYIDLLRIRKNLEILGKYWSLQFDIEVPEELMNILDAQSRQQDQILEDIRQLAEIIHSHFIEPWVTSSDHFNLYLQTIGAF